MWKEFQEGVLEADALVQREGLSVADDFAILLQEIWDLPGTMPNQTSLYARGFFGTMRNAFGGL